MTTASATAAATPTAATPRASRGNQADRVTGRPWRCLAAAGGASGGSCGVAAAAASTRSFSPGGGSAVTAIASAVAVEVIRRTSSAQAGQRAQVAFVPLALGVVECVERVRARQLVHPSGEESHQLLPRQFPSRISPSRIRVLTVPSATSSFLATCG